MAAEHRRRLSAARDGSGNADDAASLDGRISALRRGIGRLIDGYAEGLIERGEFEPRVEGMRRRLGHLEEERQRLAADAEAERSLTLLVGRLEDFASKAHAGLEVGKDKAVDGRFVSYLRVSTERQGRSGLGIEAQREAVTQFLNGGDWKLLGEHVEIESGKRDDRPELAKALAHCRRTGATLVIARLDRLSRDLAFLANLMKSGIEFRACDTPHATKFTVHILAAVAEHEREMISARTKAALAAARARGKRLGGYRGGPAPDHQAGTAALQRHSADFTANVGPIAAELRSAGASLNQIAAELASRHIQTSRGGAWTAHAVRMLLLRFDSQASRAEAA